ncbi:MAG: hypothetical protein ACREQX_19400 [Candidatus Binataceae bacterium]
MLDAMSTMPEPSGQQGLAAPRGAAVAGVIFSILMIVGLGFVRYAVPADVRMPGWFMFSTCTIGLRTAIIPRWIAAIGYACALLLVLVIASWKWITFVFPAWMLLLSIYILLSEFRSRLPVTAEAGR